jgi:hypothetical protein
VVDGFFTETPEYLPTQIVWNLRGNSSLNIWANNKDQGVQKVWRNKTEWEKMEVGMGYNRREMFMQVGSGFWFNGFQTHSGAGVEESFRMFMGAVCTPDDVSIRSHNQAYYENDTIEYGAYKPITEYAGVDEDHDDARLYPDSRFVEEKEGRKFITVARVLGERQSKISKELVAASAPPHTNFAATLKATWKRRKQVLFGDEALTLRGHKVV